jgi:hypothetical protein
MPRAMVVTTWGVIYLSVIKAKLMGFFEVMSAYFLYRT